MKPERPKWSAPTNVLMRVVVAGLLSVGVGSSNLIPLPACGAEEGPRRAAGLEHGTLAGAALTSGIAGNRWVSVGPAPIVDGRNHREERGGDGRPWTGSVSTVAVDPSDASHWLLGATNGGLWESRDAGETWVARAEEQPTQIIGAIAFSPSDPSVVYAGTGSSKSRFQQGVGLLRSDDGGATWELRAPSGSPEYLFSRIRVDPLDPQTLSVATIDGWLGLFTEEAPAGRQVPRGLAKSSDGGTSWSLTLRGSATALEVAASDFDRQFAAIGSTGGSVEGDAPNGVYRSTDAGVTWEPVPGPWDGAAGRIELALAPDPNVLYVSVQDPFDRIGADGALFGLWWTRDAWAAQPSWEQIDVSDTDDGTGRYGYCGWSEAFREKDYDCSVSHALLVDRIDSTVLFAAGHGVYRYAGERWTSIGKTRDELLGIYHTQNDLVWGGDRLIVASEGGVFSTQDTGETWQAHYRGLSLTRFRDGALHPTRSDVALGATEDAAHLSREGEVWTHLFGFGAWTKVAFSTRNPDRQWLLSLGLYVLRTKDGGEDYFEALDGLKDEVKGENWVFLTPIEQCPHDTDIFIAGSAKVWRSENFFAADFQSEWSSSRGNPDTAGALLSALAFVSTDMSCSTYALGSIDGQIFMTTNQGRNWRNLDAARTLPARYVSDLAFDPTDANVLYAVFSGSGETPVAPQRVYRSENALADQVIWENISPPENRPSYTIAVDPTDSRVIYVGTDMAVWRSDDGGDTWLHMGPTYGMPNVIVTDIEINAATGVVAAFTFGRGEYVLREVADTPTRTPTATRTPSLTPTSTPTRTPRNTPTPGPCVGDCGRDGTVSVSDLILGVNIGLGTRDLTACASFDTRTDGRLEIDELVLAVVSSLYGCLRVGE